jgi:hypothetical protein
MYLQLTLAMMEQLGGKLMSQAEHVLVFVEGVLGDEVRGLEKAKGTRRPVVEIIGYEVDEEGDGSIENLSLVETAVTLLLASLEGRLMLDNTNSSQ